MSNIVWLASYMKSGNTWTRILLANYLSDSLAPVDINKLATPMPVGYSRALFDSYCGLKISLLSEDAVERLRPDIYRTLAASTDAPQFLKIHDDWYRNDRGVPVFPGECTAGVLYIVRNVLDVAASLASHGGTDIAKAVDNLCKPLRVRAWGNLWPHYTMPQRVGSWSGHVRSWLEDSGMDCLIVRYEDLQADTIGMLRKMVCFSGLAVDEERLARAVAYSRFDAVKAQERENGFAEKFAKASGDFFRKGRTGGWREELTIEQVNRLVDAHGDVMARFGYLDGQGNPV